MKRPYSSSGNTPSANGPAARHRAGQTVEVTLEPVGYFQGERTAEFRSHHILSAHRGGHAFMPYCHLSCTLWDPVDDALQRSRDGSRALEACCDSQSIHIQLVLVVRLD